MDGLIGGLMVVVGLPIIMALLIAFYQKKFGVRFVSRGQLKKAILDQENEKRSLNFLRLGANQQYVTEAILVCKHKGIAVVVPNILDELERIYARHGKSLSKEMSSYFLKSISDNASEFERGIQKSHEEILKMHREIEAAMKK